MLAIGGVRKGQHRASVPLGSSDGTTRTWDAETGAAVGNPLYGHASSVSSVAYSPDGRHIISGSYDCSIQNWDAETGAAVGKPLRGHTEAVLSVAYSPDGRHIISAPPATPFESGRLRLVLQSEIFPRSILCGVRPLLTLLMGGTSPLPPTASFKYGMPRPVLQSEILSRGTRLGYRPFLTLPMGGTSFLDPMTAPLESGMHRLVLPPANLSIEGHTFPVQSIVSSSHRQHIVPGSSDSTTRTCDVFPCVSIRSSSCTPIHPDFCAPPDIDGWVRDAEGGLLYWIPHDCHESVHSPALLTIPLPSRNRSVSLDFDDFAFGTSWTQIFKSAPS